MQTITLHTEAGKADFATNTSGDIIKLCTIDRGSIALGRLHYQGKPDSYCLFWERGGDWMVFGDGQQHNADELDGWEPDAIREAIPQAIRLAPDCESDMAWFADWADAADQTMETNQ